MAFTCGLYSPASQAAQPVRSVMPCTADAVPRAHATHETLCEDRTAAPRNQQAVALGVEVSVSVTLAKNVHVCVALSNATAAQAT